jgi:hypothetical protein
MCPVAVVPNASSRAVSAFSAPLAGLMLEVPLAGLVQCPQVALPLACARQRPGFDFPRVLIGVHSHSQAPPRLCVPTLEGSIPLA